MLKFARQHHHRSSSMDRTNIPTKGTSVRASSVERAPPRTPNRTCSPPPPVPSRLSSKSEDQANKTGNSDYEAISTLRLLPGTRNVSMAPMTPTLQKIVSSTSSAMSPKSVLKRRYDFHRAVEKLVQEKFVPSNNNVPNGLDTSSESGYGSDQDSLNSQIQNSVQNSAVVAPATQQQPPPALPPRPRKPRKQVKFDSYVMLLQGLRDRDLETIVSHLEQVSDEAMFTQEVSSAFLTAILENREDIVTALLNRGFDVNATADSAGLTGLHLAAAFNFLPMVKIILAHGACIFALAHSSGKKAADLCSRNLPGFQACNAYLRCMEECLGIANQGQVFSSQTFHTARNDELQLSKGQRLTILRRGDYPGSSWWWCQDQNGRQGYVLREILCLNSPTSV